MPSSSSTLTSSTTPNCPPSAHRRSRWIYVGVLSTLTLALVAMPTRSTHAADCYTNTTPDSNVAPNAKSAKPCMALKQVGNGSEVVELTALEVTTYSPKAAAGSQSVLPHRTVIPAAVSAVSPRMTEAIDADNGTFSTATPVELADGFKKISGNIYPKGDVDYYAFTASTGDRVYAAMMTSASAGSSTDSQITILASDGTTVIEFDDDNGSLAGLSSSIAGAMIPSTGTYFLKVNDFTAGTTTERGYELYLQLRSGSPTVETEANDTPATANTGITWAIGMHDPAGATEQDWYSVTLNAGDAVFLSMDLDPERDGITWNGRIGFGLFGDAGTNILVLDDAGTGDVSPNPNIPSEAYFMTVKDAGTYYAFVDSASAAVGGGTATYHLNISVLPAETKAWTTYASSDVPKTLGPGTGLSSSTITIPGNPRIEDIRVNLVLTHSIMNQLDVHLRSPAGNDIGLFTDIGAATTGGQTNMNLTISDDAAIPFAYSVVKGMILKPELNYRLGWFKGEDAGGTWTLDIRDDVNDTNGGTLLGWSIEIVEDTLPTGGATIYSSDFEADDGGFTHSGTGDQWQRGLPATVATSTANPVAGLNTAHSGVNAWKTNLTGIYNVSTIHDLTSTDINLTAVTGTQVLLQWAQWYQMESASFDHAYVEVQEVGGAGSTRRVWEWLDATMTDPPGNPTVNVPASAGWAFKHADISEFIGKTIRVVFHLDADTTVSFSGLAIDDVSVTQYGGPEIAVSGNGMDIVDGDGTPDVADDTHFGSANLVGGAVTHTFTISNLGAGSLALTGTPRVVISGTDASDFSVTLQPTTPITVSGSVTFEIVFDPSAEGVRSATVGIDNTDGDETPFDFSIQGKGINTAPIISDVVDQVTDEDIVTDPITVTIDDAETAPASLIISATSSNQTLVADGNIVFGGSDMTRTVTITPAADQFGSVTIMLTVTDAGGLTAVDVFDFDVYSVNDVPVFSKGTDQSHLAGTDTAQTVVGWATGINAGPANEISQTLTFSLTELGSSGIFTTAPTIDSVSGKLAYTPNGAVGTAVFSVTLMDDGGTDYGGIDTSAAQTFTIAVVDIPISGLDAVNGSPTRLTDATDLTATIVAGSNVTYTWNFGDGDLGSGANVSHTYASVGNYTAMVTATNSISSISSRTLVTITNLAPIAQASDQSVNVGAPVVLDGSTSSDPDGHTPLSNYWTQTGGTTVTLSDLTAISPTFSAPGSVGVLTFTLVVTDAAGLVSDTPATAVITVANIPISGLSAINSSPTRLTNATRFTATVVTGSSVTYVWNFGDGQTGSGAVVNHTYAAKGNYTAVVTATNSEGSESASTVVTVTNTAPVANAGVDQIVAEGSVVTLNGSASSDPDGHTPLSYGWTQSGGPAVTLSSPAIAAPTFSAPLASTVLTFTLVVTDVAGLVDATPDNVVIRVNATTPVSKIVFLPMLRK